MAQPFSRDEMLRVGDFAALQNSTIPPSNAVSAVDNFVRMKRVEEAEQWKKRYADPTINSTVEFNKLGIEFKQLEHTIIQLDPDGDRRDWSFTAVQQSVDDTKRSWENKKRLFNGRLQKIYHDIMCNIDAHSNLLQMIPSGNTYVSVVAGAIKTLVKASKNHRDTIEALSKALRDINDEAQACQADLGLVRSEEMKYAVAKFYVHVFIFYGDSLKWYDSRSSLKIFNSLRPDFAAEFKAKLERIKELSSLVQRVRDTASAAELRVLRLQGEDLTEDVRAGLEGLERNQAELLRQQQLVNDRQQRTTEHLNKLTNAIYQEELSRQLWLKAGFQGTNLLLENGRTFDTFPTISRDCSPAITLAPPQDLEAVDHLVVSGEEQDVPNLVRRPLTWADILQEWTLSSTIISRGAIRPDFETEHVALTDNRVVFALENWTRSKKSVMLYLEGQVTLQVPSPVSLAAAQLVEKSRLVGIPVVSYFCRVDNADSLSTDESAPSIAHKADELISVIVSLAYQVASQLPPADPIPSRIQDLLEAMTGTEWTFENGIQFLEAMLDYAPALLLLIIDSFESLCGTNSKQAAQFRQILRTTVKAGKYENKTIKVLFTCPDRCRELISELDDDEIALLECSKQVGMSPLYF